VRFSLRANAPPEASIDAATGEFSWTPPPDQAAGKYDLTLSAQGPDGQTAQTTFVVTVNVTPPPEKEIAVDLGDGVKLEMVLIPAGSFRMGDEGEKPVHKVNITKPFYLGKYLVTQEQWEAVMGSNPSHFKGPKQPVEQVSWIDCQQFFTKLNEKLHPEGGKFQLPTEAQWEYACRAGSTTKYCFGDDETRLGDYAWYR
jgi:formylglycine-generating enzyme required for sulfatase activity